jgi:tetratricopeptide (TPR) repeat protein
MRLLLATAAVCVLAAGLVVWNLLRNYYAGPARNSERLASASGPIRVDGSDVPAGVAAAGAGANRYFATANNLGKGANTQAQRAESQRAEVSGSEAVSIGDSQDFGAGADRPSQTAPVRWAGEVSRQAALDKLSAAREALKRDPGHRLALRDELEALVELGRWSEAADTLARLAAVEPEDPRWLRERAVCLLRLSCFAGALGPLREYVARVPEDDQAWSWLAAAQQALGHLQDAEQSWSRVLALRPAEVEALACRGQVRLALHEWSGAAADFELACELDPENIEAAIGLSAALGELGEHAAACQRLRVVLERHPHHIRAMNQLAELYWRSWTAGGTAADRSAAIDCWQRSLALDPDQPQIRSRLEQALGQAP